MLIRCYLSNVYVKLTFFIVCVILIAKIALMYVKAKNEGENRSVTKSVRPLKKMLCYLSASLDTNLDTIFVDTV